MARWRLMNAHYLNVPGTEWEYTEVSRATGKQARVRYPVGLFLDPKDSQDHNYPGEIIVSLAKSSDKADLALAKHLHPNDIVFVGNPTPDMEPLDDEAERISAEWKPKWVRPMSEDALPGYGDYSQSLIKTFEAQLTQIVDKVGGIPKATENVSIRSTEFEALKRQVAELAKQNAMLLAKEKATVK